MLDKYGRNSTLQQEPFNEVIFKNYVLFNEICNKYGLKDTNDYLDKMIFIDYLIGDDDRHLYNFGIIRDADTLNWIKPVPLYDNENSLAYNLNIIDNVDDITDTVCRWFSDSNLNKLKYINYPQWYDNMYKHSN